MNRTTGWFTILLLCAAVCSAGIGCIGGAATEPSRFYVLHAMTESSDAVRPSDGAHNLKILVGPVSVPEYINRPQITLRLGPNKVRRSEFNRWSEPLDQNMSRIIAENLLLLVGTKQLYLFPLRLNIPVDFQVKVDVLRFDSTPDGEASFDVRWTIMKPKTQEVLIMNKQLYTESTEGVGFEAYVAAMNRTVDQLSRDIAGALRSLAQQ